MADLVSHVVDKECIPHRLIGARHPGRLVRGAQHAEPGQATSPGIDHMPDIECAQLTIGEGFSLYQDVLAGVISLIDAAHAAHVVRVIAVVERVCYRIGKDDVVVAAGQLKLGPHISLVHLVDPVEQGSNGRQGQHLGAAMILGVLTCGRDSDGVTFANITIHLHLASQRFGVSPDHLVGVFFQSAVGILLVVNCIPLGIAQRIDKHHLALMAEHGMKTLRPQIEASSINRMSRVVPLEGADLRILGCKVCGQYIVSFQCKGNLPPIRQWQGQLAGPRLQPGKIVERHLGDPELMSPYLITLVSCCSGGNRAPFAGHQAG